MKTSTMTKKVVNKQYKSIKKKEKKIYILKWHKRNKGKKSKTLKAWKDRQKVKKNNKIRKIDIIAGVWLVQRQAFSF
jgi:hypothetical protein